MGTNTNENNSIENAFSDLIAQYFNEGTVNNTPNGNYQANAGSIGDNLNTNPLYTNLSPIGTPTDDEPNFEQAPIGGLNQPETAGNKNYLYNNLTDEPVVPTETATPATNLYNVITPSGVESQEEASLGADFKLTQGNLPAKIGFWTKVKNFFRADSKIQYTPGETAENNKGLWNKLQNLFSFGDRQ